jgi:hypothetical protein
MKRDTRSPSGGGPARPQAREREFFDRRGLRVEGTQARLSFALTLINRACLYTLIPSRPWHGRAGL